MNFFRCGMRSFNQVKPINKFSSGNTPCNGALSRTFLLFVWFIDGDILKWVMMIEVLNYALRLGSYVSINGITRSVVGLLLPVWSSVWFLRGRNASSNIQQSQIWFSSNTYSTLAIGAKIEKKWLNFFNCVQLISYLQLNLIKVETILQLVIEVGEWSYLRGLTLRMYVMLLLSLSLWVLMTF